MKISKSGKIFLGILTIGQLFLSLLILVWVFSVFLPLAMQPDSAELDSLIIVSLGKFVVGFILVAIIQLGLLIFYIIHAGTNRHISTAMRVVWIVLIFVIGSIVQVVYYFMEIIPEKSLTAKLEHNE